MKPGIESLRNRKALCLLVASTAATAAAEPAITAQPRSQTASLFADATLRVTATDTQAMAFQWLFNAAPITGAVTNSLTITNVQRADAGEYAVVVSDTSGSVTSQVATLSIVPFNALYCFGYSWTDTQGLFPDGSYDFAHNNPQYWQNRTANGPMWPEFLSTNLGLIYVPANNYARGGAESSDVLNLVMTGSFGTKPALNLYFLWACGDFLDAADSNYTGSTPYIPWTNEVAWNVMIQNTVRNNSNAVEHLYAKGARMIVVQNLDDYSRHPAVVQDFGNNTNRFLAFRRHAEAFNAELDLAMQAIASTKPDLRLLLLDMYSKLNEAQDNFAAYGFTKIFPNALNDPTLQDKSFGGPGKDYFYWDGLHATSKLNALIATWCSALLTNAVVETLDSSFASRAQIQMNRLQIGRDYTLQTSADLVDWQEVKTFTASEGTNQWTSELYPPGWNGFYRLTWHP
jgi:phospholipase/lecithinase/hemolysin